MKDYVLHEVFEKPVQVDEENKLYVSDDEIAPNTIKFCPNQFPYNTAGRHHVLWFGCNEEPNINITNVVMRELKRHLGHDNFDFAWYCNPKMSLPDFYHVQVFWVSLAYYILM